MFFLMEECRADKNWAHLKRIKEIKNSSYQKISTPKVVLLIQYSYKKIFYGKSSQLVILLNDLENVKDIIVNPEFLHFKRHQNFLQTWSLLDKIRLIFVYTMLKHHN
jgi:hypothetical protein